MENQITIREAITETDVALFWEGERYCSEINAGSTDMVQGEWYIELNSMLCPV